jgi:hypothetical protein
MYINHEWDSNWDRKKIVLRKIYYHCLFLGETITRRKIIFGSVRRHYMLPTRQDIATPIVSLRLHFGHLHYLWNRFYRAMGAGIHPEWGSRSYTRV